MLVVFPRSHRRDQNFRRHREARKDFSAIGIGFGSRTTECLVPMTSIFYWIWSNKMFCTGTKLKWLMLDDETIHIWQYFTSIRRVSIRTVTSRNAPDHCIQCLNSFPVHPLILNFDNISVAIALLLLKQVHATRKERFVPSLEQCD